MGAEWSSAARDRLRGGGRRIGTAGAVDDHELPVDWECPSCGSSDYEWIGYFPE